MRIATLLAAAALTGGLALTGAGAAQATEWTYNLFGPFVDEASCNDNRVWWSENQPGVITGSCFYTTTPPQGVGYGWFHYAYSPI